VNADATDEDRHDLFDGIGTIVSSEVTATNEKAATKDWIVEFSEVSEAQKAVEFLHGKAFMGNELKVTAASEGGAAATPAAENAPPEPEADSEAEAPTESEAEAPTEPEADAPVSEPVAEAPAEPEAEAPTDSEADAPTDPEADAPVSELAAEAEPDVEPEVVPAPEPETWEPSADAEESGEEPKS
jgi:hypothetical protein